MEKSKQEQSEKRLGDYQAINLALNRLGMILFEIAQSAKGDSTQGGKEKRELIGNIKKIKNGKRNENDHKEGN